ncbi:MAG: glycosyltransferase family 4 protein [Candidatus Sulfotelmatobacter sp.]
MRVLQIHKTFRLTGGADTFFFKTCDLLEEHRHAVAHFSTRHPQNLPSPFADYFVDGFTDERVKQLSLTRQLKAFFNGIYSFDAKRKLSRLLEDFKPDVAHVHSFNYQLSPAIFDVFRNSRVPLVVTLHDYHVICGAGTLYVDGAICERCRGGRHYNLLRHSCYWNLPASLMATLSHYLHDARRSWSAPAKLLAPSRFLMGKLIEFGIPASRLVHVPIFVDTDFVDTDTDIDIDFSAEAAENQSPAEYVLYFGQMGSTKGIDVLLKAVKDLDCRLLLIGDGPLSGWVEEQCAASGGKVRRIAFVASRQELRRYIQRAAFSVVPSVWYENQPATILETYAASRPVIGSRLGGIPELIDENRTGLLCPPGNAAALAEAVRFLLERPELCRKWGQAGQRKLQEEFSRESHYRRLMAVYSSVLQAN